MHFFKNRIIYFIVFYLPVNIIAQTEKIKYYDVAKYILMVVESDSNTLSFQKNTYLYDTTIAIKKGKSLRFYRISLLPKDSTNQYFTFCTKGISKEKLLKKYRYEAIDTNIKRTLYGSILVEGISYQIVLPLGKHRLDKKTPLTLYTLTLNPSTILFKIDITKNIKFCYSEVLGLFKTIDKEIGPVFIDNINYIWFIESID